MKKAIQSAAKWLKERAAADPKLNPIPYAFFRSAVSKNLDWAKSQRGVILNFDTLAQAVRSELIKAGIRVMSESGKGKSEAPEASPENNGSAEFVCNGCSGLNVDKKECPLYNVIVAQSGRNVHIFMCAFYHDTQNCQTPVTDEILSQEDSIYE